MSAAKAADTKNKKWDLTGSWAGAWKIALGVGVVGLVGAGVGFTMDPRRFAFSWLFAFITCLTVALGMLFFVLIQHLTSAGWSVTVRRTAEFWGFGIIVLVPLFLPVLLKMNELFPWLRHGGEHHAKIELVTPAYAQPAGGNAPAGQPNTQVGQPAAKPAGQTPDTNPDPHANTPHGQAPPANVADPAGKLPGAARDLPPDSPHAAGASQHPGHDVPGAQRGTQSAHGAHAGGKDPHAVVHNELLEKKKPYLNQTFFFVRMGIYFIVWILLAVKLFGYSTQQDTSKDPELTRRAARFAPGATVLFALSLTFAMFDWVMSLEPTWFSTIFGVVMFATGVISSLSVLILHTMALKNAGPLEGAVTVEHYHDLGKLLFGFLVFWAYVSFSQFMLIWYAALPEETTFFHNRYDVAPWKRVSEAIVIFHFVVPFFWLMSRWFKRNLGRLQAGATLVLVMHAVDIYWYVMPNFNLGKPMDFHWLDIACLLAVGGIYAAFVMFRMTKFPLIPIGDPRLQRALHFQNA